jgi:hypothetical protein
MECDPYMPFDEWKRLGARLATYSNATSWWIGDWLVFGRVHYGLSRYRAAVGGTGLEYKTLRNYAMVARRFEPTRRREDLSFQHHAEVCGLNEEAQDYWLELAVKHGWSKRELRRNVRAAPAIARTVPAPAILRLVLAPSRDERWRAAARMTSDDLESWVLRCLDDAADRVLVGAPDKGGTAAGTAASRLKQPAQLRDARGRRAPLRALATAKHAERHTPR